MNIKVAKLRIRISDTTDLAGAPNEDIVQTHLT